MHILIVDDEPAIREISARVLVRAGFTVDVAEDGEAAWEAVERRGYDLIITDQNMPRLDGTGLIGRLHAAGLRTPVIMITGGALAGSVTKHAPAPDSLMTKPFRFPALLEEMKRLMCLAPV